MKAIARERAIPRRTWAQQFYFRLTCAHHDRSFLLHYGWFDSQFRGPQINTNIVNSSTSDWLFFLFFIIRHCCVSFFISSFYFRSLAGFVFPTAFTLCRARILHFVLIKITYNSDILIVSVLVVSFVWTLLKRAGLFFSLSFFFFALYVFRLISIREQCMDSIQNESRAHDYNAFENVCVCSGCCCRFFFSLHFVADPISESHARDMLFFLLQNGNGINFITLQCAAAAA